MSQASLERAVPAGDRLLLDSTTLIAYLDGRERVSPVATHIIDSFVSWGRNSAIVSTVSAMAVLVRPLRPGPGEPYRHVIDFLTRFPNLRPGVIDLVVAQEAASLHATHRFTSPDALVVATGIVNQVGHLITNDNEWPRRRQPLADRVSICYLEDHLPFP